MKRWRPVLGVLTVLSILPLIFSWGPWYLLLLLPLALTLLSLYNDVVIARKEREELRRMDASTIGHEYRE